MIIDMNLAFLDDIAPMDISITPVLTVIGLFVGLGIIFVGIQMRREYHWLHSLGGVSTLFDVDDI